MKTAPVAYQSPKGVKMRYVNQNYTQTITLPTVFVCSKYPANLSANLDRGEGRSIRKPCSEKDGWILG